MPDHFTIGRVLKLKLVEVGRNEVGLAARDEATCGPTIDNLVKRRGTSILIVALLSIA